MIEDVLVFTPVYRLEPETVQSVLSLEWPGAISWLFQRDNPHEGESQTTGVLNRLHQYQRGREVFLQGDWQAMMVIESDIIVPDDALQRLAALDADLAYGVYLFRTSPVVNLFCRYKTADGQRAKNVGESLTTRGQWPPAEAQAQRGPLAVSGAGLGCTLIKRHVLAEIDFRTLNPQLNPDVNCDTWFTIDCWRAGYEMMADTRVVCGHKTPEGEVLWPPA